MVEYVQVFNDHIISKGFSPEADELVEDGECIPEGAVGTLGYDMKGFIGRFNGLLFGNVFQVAYNIGYVDPSEIKDLAPREYGRYDLMLFSGGKDELCIIGRLLKGFKEGIESRLRKHMDLIDYVNLVPAYLRGDPHLVDQVPYIIHRIVGGRIELVYVERGRLVERNTRFTFVARLNVFGWVETVDGLGQYPGTGCFPYTPRPCKKECLCKLPVLDGIFQRVGNRFLPHNRVESGRPVFSC